MYTIGTYITEPIGNNEFSYQERIALGSQAKIFVPPLKIGTAADLELGSEIVFEEVNEGKLISCVGLQNFIQTTYKEIPTYIFDNHNHAYGFRHLQTQQTAAEEFKPFTVIHIDQHADTKPNTNTKGNRNRNIETFVNEKTNVGNFISAALHNNIIDEIIQIRSEHALHNMEKLDFQEKNYIIDIDVDFWENKTDKEIESDFEIIKKLIDNVCLITIATSPYFFDQKKAIELIKHLLQ